MPQQPPRILPGNIPIVYEKRWKMIEADALPDFIGKYTLRYRARRLFSLIYYQK